MKKQPILKNIALLLLTTGCTTPVMAASYQIWTQDAASVGNYHAGRAAIADDASTNFYNPAGLIRIHNQQLVAGGTPTTSDMRFRGTIATNTLANLITASLPHYQVQIRLQKILARAMAMDSMRVYFIVHQTILASVLIFSRKLSIIYTVVAVIFQVH